MDRDEGGDKRSHVPLAVPPCLGRRRCDILPDYTAVNKSQHLWLRTFRFHPKTTVGQHNTTQRGHKHTPHKHTQLVHNDNEESSECYRARRILMCFFFLCRPGFKQRRGRPKKFQFLLFTELLKLHIRRFIRPITFTACTVKASCAE